MQRQGKIPFEALRVKGIQQGGDPGNKACSGYNFPKHSFHSFSRECHDYGNYDAGKQRHQMNSGTGNKGLKIHSISATRVEERTRRPQRQEKKPGEPAAPS